MAVTSNTLEFNQAAIITEAFTDPFNIQGMDSVSGVISWSNGNGSQSHEIQGQVTNDDPNIAGSTVKWATIDLDEPFTITSGSGNSGTKFLQWTGAEARFFRFRVNRSAGQVDVRIKGYAEGRA